MEHMEASGRQESIVRPTHGQAQVNEHSFVHDQTDESQVSSTFDELPSYKLRRDRKDSSFTAKRASAGSYFPPPSSSTSDDTPSEAIAAKIPSRRSSVASLRPFVTAIAVSNRLAVKAVDKQESQRYEAMVQHFHVRRLKFPNEPQELPRTPKSNDTEDHEDRVNEPLRYEALKSKRSTSLELRRQSVDTSQSLDGETQVAPRSSICSIGAHEQYITKLSILASSQPRYSLSRQIKSWRHKFSKTCRPMLALLSEPMSPLSTAAQVRGVFLLIACTWYVTYIPLKLAFYGNSATYLCACVEIALEVLFIADFLLGFNTSFVDKSGDMVTSRAMIAWHYCRGWCVPDLLSSIPVGIIAILRDGQMNPQDTLWSGSIRILRLAHVMLAIRMLWFARARRALKGFSAWFLYSRYSHLHRIAWVLLIIVFISHWMACGWKLLAADPAIPVGLAEDYASNFYDALQLLQGQGLVTETLGQNLFASLAVLVGSIVLAVVFGHVAMLVSNFNANSTNYQRKMETLFAVMTKLELPVLLRERVHQYYEHLWREYDSFDGELMRFSKELTNTLELEVLLFKYMAVIMHAPIWHECSPDFLKQIILKIQVRVYLPDDYIIRRGEVGDEYYIINRGFCELLTGPDSFERASTPLAMNKRQGSFPRSSIAYDDSDVITAEAKRKNSGSDGRRSRKYRIVRPTSSDGNLATKLSCGQSFGEMALIMNYQRTADARALTYVEMCVLKREHFQRILVRYPQDRKCVLTKILSTTMTNNDIHKVDCPLIKIVRSVFASSADDKSIKAQQAAELIIEVINNEKEDETLTFGIDLQLQQRLMALNEQRKRSLFDSDSHSLPHARLRVARDVQASRTAMHTTMEGTDEPVSLASLQARVALVEASQMEMLQTIQQIHAALIEIKDHDNQPAGSHAASTAETPPGNAPTEVNWPGDESAPTHTPTLQPNISLRRVFSAPSTDTQAVIDAAAEAVVKASQASRRNSHMHVAMTAPHSRGLLRRIGSIVSAGFVSQEPAPSVSQFADQLFFSRRQGDNDR